jgi:hypothetical protein
MSRSGWVLLTLLGLALVGGHAGAACSSPAEAAAKAHADHGALDRTPSPALPVTWPPTGRPAVRYLDFRHEALPTGVVSYAVWSPQHERIVPLDDGPVRDRALGKSRRLGVFTLHGERASTTAAEATLFAAVCAERPPTDAESAVIRAGYRAWIEEDPAMKPELEKLAASFLTWLYPPVAPTKPARRAP